MFNTDQGAQFTSEAFTGKLKEEGISLSMDGKGRWRDNVFVERIWRVDQVRGGLPACLRLGQRGQNFDRQLPRVLRLHPATLQPESAHARSGILPPPARVPGSLNKNKNKNFHLRKKQKLSELPEPPLSAFSRRHPSLS